MKSEERIAVISTYGVQVIFFWLIQAIIKLRLIITLPILSRLIGTEGYGVLSILAAFVGIVQMIAVFGINTALTIFIPWLKDNTQKGREFWIAAQAVLSASVVLTVLILLLRNKILTLFFPAGFNVLYFLFGVLAIPFYAFNLALQAQVINNYQGGPFTLCVAIANITEFILVLAAAYYFGVGGVLIASLIGQLLLAILTISVIIQRDPFTLLKASFLKEIKKYYAYGSIILLISFAAWVMDASDRIIIGKFFSLSEVGVYHVSYNLCSHISYMAAPFFSPLMPFVASAVSAGNPNNATQVLEKTYRFLIMIFVPVVIFFSLEGKDILAILSTQPFYRGFSIIPLVASGVALFAMTGIFQYILHANKEGKLVVLSMGTAAFVNLALNIVFIPRFGIMAAAAATLVSYSIFFVLIRYFACRLLPVVVQKVFLSKVIASALVSAGVMFLAMNFFSSLLPRFIFALVLGFASYVFVIFAIGAITEDERRQLWRLIGTVLPIRDGRG